MRVHFVTALAVSAPLGIITAFLMTIALKARRNKVVTGAQGMVGEVGTAQSALAPSGKILVHGEIWNAVSSSPVPNGSRVIVRKVDGLQLEVAPVTVTESEPSPLPTAAS
jgi:membrane-bound serine protease (ClpP class)